MALILTRKQSIAVGLGLLGTFFIASTAIIYQRSNARIPTSSESLTKESVEGPALVYTPGTSSTPGQASGFVLDEFHRSLVRDGRTVWEVYGTKGRYSPATNSAEVEHPRLTLTRKDDEHVALTASRAQLYLEGSDLVRAELFDDVVLTYKDETTLKTSRANYDKKANTVEVPAYVEVENETLKITGNRLTGNLDSQEFTLSNGVTSVIKPRKR